MTSRKGSPDFDYHLNPKEQKSVEQLVPLHQAKIHIAIRANINLDDSEYEQGACCLSEHLLVICKKRMFGGSFSLVKIYHLLDITNMETTDDFTFHLSTSDSTVMITTGEAMRLARNILRNIILSTALIPPNLRLNFRPHDEKHFPPFKPLLSPSQSFQFTYNAQCSYYDSTYFHEVVQFYHKNLVTSQGIFDLNQLPLHLLECNLRNPIDLHPFFAALMFSPFIFGIKCSDISHPELLKSIAPLLGTNQTIRIVSLPNCGLVNGLAEFARGIMLNKDIKVSYWDLSGNKFEDSTPLMLAFASYPFPIFHLDLGNCGLDKQSIEILFRSISTNKNLWKIQNLHIPGSDLNQSNCRILQDHFKNMNERGYLHMKTLDIGQVSSGFEIIMESLVSYPQPIEVLRFPGTNLKTSSFSALISFIAASEKLKELDVSNTGISSEQICQIVVTISRNESIKEMKLHIGGLKLNGNKLFAVLEALRENKPKKWKLLNLEDNRLTMEDLDSIISVIPKLSHLTSLKIGKNFSYSHKGVGEQLVRLIEIRQIQSLSIDGIKKKGLRQEIQPLLWAMKKNTNIKSLDIRLNYFGDSGLEELGHAIRNNRVLNELRFDGARPENIQSIFDFLDCMAESPSLIYCEFPNDDVYKALAKHKSKERDSYSQTISEKQYLVSHRILTNMAKLGVNSVFSIKNNNTLNQLIDDLTVNLIQMLQRINLHLHSGINGILGLKLPFVNDKTSTIELQTNDISIPGAAEYDSQEMTKQIVEKVADDLSSLNTLQFNSLCIRRPTLSSGKVATAPSSFKKNDESDEEYEESDDESQSSNVQPTAMMPTH